MNAKSMLLLYRSGKDDEVSRRRTLNEFLLTLQKGSRASITKDGPKNHDVGAIAVSMVGRTVIYGHAKDTFHDKDCYQLIRKEAMRNADKVNIVAGTISPTLGAACDEDALIRYCGNVCVIPLLGSTNYFWTWAPEHQKAFSDQNLYSYVAAALSTIADKEVLSTKHIQEYIAVEDGKLEFMCFDTRDTSQVYCVTAISDSLSSSTDLMDSEPDIYIFSNSDSNIFGNSTIVLSGLGPDTAEYAYLAACCDTHPSKIKRNMVVSIDRNSQFCKVMSLLNNQTLIKGVS